RGRQAATALAPTACSRNSALAWARTGGSPSPPTSRRPRYQRAGSRLLLPTRRELPDACTVSVARRLHLCCSALPNDERAPVRALLPLSLVPARVRQRLCAQRHDRGGSGTVARWRTRRRAHCVEQRQGPEDRPLSDLSHRGVE